MALRKLSSTDAFIITDLEDVPCFGIVRSAPKILQGGAKDLARSMTYTFAAFEMQYGGASGGINAKPDERSQAISSFVDEIEESVRDGSLGVDPGKGIDTGSFDSLSAIDHRNQIRFETYQKDPLHLYLSGLGPVECADHLLDLDGKTAAIEGFGAHSVVMAELLEERGAKVIAVSTLSGSLVNSDGMSADDIRDRWNNDGADFVVGEREEAEPAWKIFQCGADIMFAGSKMGAINHTTAEKLKLEALIPHQPLPFTAKALAVLQKNGCVVVPCFIPVAGPLFSYWNNDGTDLADVVSKAASNIKTVLDEAKGHEDGLFLASCYRAETFLASWQENLPFGRPLAS